MPALPPRMPPPPRGPMPDWMDRFGFNLRSLIQGPWEKDAWNYVDPTVRARIRPEWQERLRGTAPAIPQKFAPLPNGYIGGTYSPRYGAYRDVVSYNQDVGPEVGTMTHELVGHGASIINARNDANVLARGAAGTSPAFADAVREGYRSQGIRGVDDPAFNNEIMVQRLGSVGFDPARLNTEEKRHWSFLFTPQALGIVPKKHDGPDWAERRTQANKVQATRTVIRRNKNNTYMERGR